MLFGKTNKEAMIQPGRLAKKMGIDKRTLIKYLEKSGLFSQCVRDEKGWLWIPWSVAVEFAGAETLAVEPKRRKTRGRKRKQDDFDREMEELFRQPQPPQFRRGSDKRMAELERHSRTVARDLVRAGVTIKDFIAWKNKEYSQRNIDKGEVDVQEKVHENSAEEGANTTNPQ